MKNPCDDCFITPGICTQLCPEKNNYMSILRDAVKPYYSIRFKSSHQKALLQNLEALIQKAEDENWEIYKRANGGFSFSIGSSSGPSGSSTSYTTAPKQYAANSIYGANSYGKARQNQITHSQRRKFLFR